MTGPITPHRDPNNGWRPDSNPIYKKTNEGIEQVAKPAVEAVAKQTTQGGWKDKIDQLDSKGDTARSRVQLDGEVDVNISLLVPGYGKVAAEALKKVGVSLDGVAKAQGTHSIDVTRDSNAPDSTYTVRYTKMGQAGLGAELTAGLPDKIGDQFALPLPGGAKALPVPQGFLRGDKFLGTSNTVEMRFNSKEEAQRAAEALEKLAAADMVDDGVQAGIQSLSGLQGPAGLPARLLGADPLSQAYEGSANNLANPMSEYGEVNPGLRRAAGVSDEDMKFLGDSVVAQEFSVLGGNRMAVEGRLSGKGELTLPGGAQLPGGKITLKGLEVRAGKAIVPGVQQINTYTRRVEYPTDVSAGRVTDSFSAFSMISAKERDVVAAGVSFGGSKGVTVQGQGRHDDNYELALATTSISYSQSIPPGTKVDAAYLAATPPDLSKPATVESSVMTPTSAEAAGLLSTFNPLGGQYGEAPGGQHRVDMNRDYKKYEVSGPTALAMGTAMATGEGVGGFTGNSFAVLRQGDFIDNRMDVVQRNGHNTTDTLRAGAVNYIAAEGSLSRLTGVDDYDTADPVQPDPTPPDDPTGPEPVEPKPVEPKPQPTHWQVQPYEGVNVRSSPTTDADNKVAIVQSGSFLDGTGETKVDKDGYTWIKVNGRDQEDKMVEGWVRGDNLKSYDKRFGDNDATGRVNPALEKKDQDKIIVKQDDNLWNLAAKHDQDFDKLLAANPHLLDPNLIFKGDSVYLPGR